jgi:2-keto-3-deoxy-L-rhamnonate aldolase RhmA
MSEAFELHNPAKRRLAAGEFVLAMTVRQLRTAEAALIVEAAGFDTIIVDAEHSTISAEATSSICAAALALGMTPMVRIASHAGSAIGAALDGGALGLIVPRIETRAEAEAIAAEALYPPQGRRSVAGLAATTRYRALPLDAVMRQRNAALLLIAMIETAAGIANAEAIAAVPGIDGLLIGPNDLAAELGIAGQKNHPKLREAHEKVGAACRAQRKTFAVATFGDERAFQAELVALGARFIMAGIDVNYVLAAAKRDAEALKTLRK